MASLLDAKSFQQISLEATGSVDADFSRGKSVLPKRATAPAAQETTTTTTRKKEGDDEARPKRKT